MTKEETHIGTLNRATERERRKTSLNISRRWRCAETQAECRGNGADIVQNETTPVNMTRVDELRTPHFHM